MLSTALIMLLSLTLATSDVVPPQEGEKVSTQAISACKPSPCGRHTICSEASGAAACECKTGYTGDPYNNCVGDCKMSNDCSGDKACLNEQCRDPCPGSCGINAKCDVKNHVPICTCPENTFGDPFIRCGSQ